MWLGPQTCRPCRISVPKRIAATEGLLGGPVEKNKVKAIAASPIHYVSKDDPPFLIVHGEGG
jgi:dipeptidyl aminopeptidase/acylaminoacyl peptidase